MKRQYLKPEMQTVKINSQTHLLTTSVTVEKTERYFDNDEYND